MLKGIGASQGYGIGNAVIIQDKGFDYSSIRFSTKENEEKRVEEAIVRFEKRTRALANELREKTGADEAQIIEGHLTMVRDPFLTTRIKQRIALGIVAEAAVDASCSEFVELFSSVEDELTRQRSSDIRDIRDSLMGIMLNVESANISELKENSVIVTKELTPSMTSQINKKNVSAIITETGGVTSHSAILARAMGIPAVLSAAGATAALSDGDRLIVDGFDGRIIIDPTQEELDEYTKRQSAFLKARESLSAYLSKPTVTKSGAIKQIYGNITAPDDAQGVLQNGGEGIGLFRTEFLFMERSSAPSEEEQFEAYSTVARALDGRDVIIRTLDIGGDKPIDYLSIDKEENAFLGHRAIRYCLDNTEIFKTQLRAIMRAAVHGNIKLMLPFVTTLDEVQRARALIDDCVAELDSEGKDYRRTEVGIMIETPSAALISDILANEVDFFSIGTNDLTGYIMAVDRGNAKVSGLYDAAQPSVLKAIEMTIKNAKSAGIPVGMCGEAAADEKIIPLLVEWGIDELSVSPSSILQTRRAVCNCK